jgi:hypothetical protein
MSSGPSGGENEPDNIGAHGHSANHRSEIMESELCGCFYCLSTFIPTAIAEWVDDGATALCPSCGIDSVLGSKAGHPLTNEYLGQMHRRWFGSP